jgi:hypothetical protein
VNRAEAVTTQLEVVGHDAGASVAKVKSRLLVEGMAWIGIWNVSASFERRAIVLLHRTKPCPRAG